jgi:hypothetical protein
MRQLHFSQLGNMDKKFRNYVNCNKSCSKIIFILVVYRSNKKTH